jgi:imidazole glycerol phosphate synthase subunit HisF
LLLKSVRRGARKIECFSRIFEKTDMEAALAAGILHRKKARIAAPAKEGQRRDT